MIRSSNPGRGKGFSLLQNFYTGCGAHRHPIKYVPPCFPEVNRTGREFYHSHPSSAEVKSGALPLLPVYASMALKGKLYVYFYNY